MSLAEINTRFKNAKTPEYLKTYKAKQNWGHGQTLIESIHRD